MPSDILALLPSPEFPPAALESVLLGEGQGASPEALAAVSDSLPSEISRFLAQEEVELVGRIYSLVSELEEEREWMVQVGERSRGSLACLLTPRYFVYRRVVRAAAAVKKRTEC